MNLAPISSSALLMGLIFCGCFSSAWAQTVIASVCYEAKPETLTRTMNSSFCVGPTGVGACNTHEVGIGSGVQLGYYKVILNPGPTQETLYGFNGSSGLFLYSLGLPSQSFSVAHAPGETVLLISEGEAVYGYNNLSSTTVNIPRGVSSHNFFAPGSLIYTGQTTSFQPGAHGDVLRLRASAGAPAATWFLNGSEAVPSISAGQGCGTITYQGRLSDAGSAANGQFDLQFQAFETDTGGIAQSELITLQDVQVTGGIFTVPLFFGSTFINNFKPRFLQIGVRPGIAPDTDPFTLLTPRQPLTTVPFSINAVSAANAEQLGGVAANQYFRSTGGTVSGTLTVTGTINGTATNATQLGGVAANQFVQTTDSRLSDARTPTANSSNYIQNTNTQQTANFNINGNGTIGGNLTTTGTISNGCRSGFTAIAGGRLCVSATQAAATFYGGTGAIQTCTNMQARVGNSADVMLTFSNSGFNYFTGAIQGWLADHSADNTWGTWVTLGAQPDFDGPPLNVYTGGSGGTAPSLPFRCVY